MEKALRSALADGEADVAYCRVMLLGPAGVGKTSFKRGLMGETFHPDSDSTIIAEVTSVINREWMKRDDMNKWRDVCEEDEIDELSRLMMIVNESRALEPQMLMPNQIPGHVSHLKRVYQLMQSKIIQKAIKKSLQKGEMVEMKKPDHQLNFEPFFHLWDCGGQPVFLEVLPIFLTCRTMFLMFFDAAKDLKKPWESVYRHNGKEISEGMVNCSTLEMMERWMALIYSHLLQEKNDPGYPRVISIGTRKDQLIETGKEAAVRKEVDEIFVGRKFNRILKEILFVNNTTSGASNTEDPAYKIVKEIISTFASKNLNRKTPISWVLLRKYMQLFVDESEENVITLDEAHAIGSMCNVKQKDIPQVLRFYHELGVFLYYPQIEGLQDKIILSPQWFVTSLGLILAPPPISVMEDRELQNEWQLLRRFGILVERLYTSIWEKCKGLNPKSLIELLTYFQLAVKVEDSIETGIHCDDCVEKFFVPAVLPYFPSHSPSSDVSPASQQCKTAPLHITFNTDFVIPGFFTRLSTTVLKVNNAAHPKLSLYFQDGIYHDMVKYAFEPLPTVFITLTERSDAIEINLEYDSVLPQQVLWKLCQNLKDFLEACCNEVQQCLKSLNPNLSQISSSVCKFKVVCQNRECKGKKDPHYLKTPHNLQGTISIACSENDKRVRPISLQEAFWYKETKDFAFDPVSKEVRIAQNVIGDDLPFEERITQETLVQQKLIVAPHQEILSILKSKSADIISVIADPIRLANDLYSHNMLADTVYEEVIAGDDARRYKNASRLMNEVKKCCFLAATDRDSTDQFYKLCDVLVKQANPPLTQLVEKMKSSMCRSTSAQ